MKAIQLPTKARVTSDLVPDLQLAHGRSLWVLAKMGFAAGVTSGTFNHYVKSLRKLGVPFAHGEIGTGSGKPVRYSFNHLMELSLALTLRIYGTLPDPVLEGLVQFRHDLYALYRRAYLEYATGLGAPVQVTAKDRSPFEMSGVYLDLHIRFGGGRAFEFGPPRLLSPFEALRVFARLDTPGRAHLPLNLSLLAIGLVECAEAAPRLRRGPPPRSGASDGEASQPR
jgi:hypothetical protein